MYVGRRMKTKDDIQLHMYRPLLKVSSYNELVCIPPIVHVSWLIKTC